MRSDQAFAALRKISNASGGMKFTLLRKFPELKPYLLAAYDPYTRYYTTVPAYVSGQGQLQFDGSTWGLLNCLSTRVISGTAATVACCDHVKGLTEDSGELFKRILNKDMRIGMGPKSINRVFPGYIPMHNVMLAKIFDKKRVKFPCFGSPKIDGVRAIYREGKFYSRNGHIYEGLGALEDQLKDIPEVIDGELTVPGKTFQEGSGMIRRGTSTPNAQFCMFDLPEYRGPFIERLVSLENLHLHGPNLVKVPHVDLYSLDEVMSFYNNCRSNQYEGAVIKPVDYKYVGTRSWNWMKMKNVLTEDLRVTGVFEGTGKYAKQLGGIIVDYRGTAVRVGSGFSDRQRETLWEIADEVIGRIAEVLYMEVTDGGSLRHPRFVGFRPDKEDSYGGV